MAETEKNISSANPEYVAFIACSGCGAQKSNKSNCSSCAEAIEKGLKRDECQNGCLGVGSCVSCCKYGALSLVDGKIVVDRNKCNGCGDCTKNICPRNLISLIPADVTNFIPCSSEIEDEETVRNICGHGCIACGECERACPVGAITIQNNHAVIDYTKCVGCSACALKCKKKIIVDTLHDITKLKDKVAFVKCSGGNKAKAVYEELGVKDCKAAVQVDPREHNLCTSSCCGLGNCTKVCRFGAISVINGTAYVDPEKCVGCRDCVRECPRHLISIVPYKGVKQVPCSSKADYYDKAQVCDSGCTACMDCFENCPNGAIYLEDKHAVIDGDICVNCNVCQYVCGRNVIKELKVPDFVELQRIAMHRIDEGAQRK